MSPLKRVSLNCFRYKCTTHRNALHHVFNTAVSSDQMWYCLRFHNQLTSCGLVNLADKYDCRLNKPAEYLKLERRQDSLGEYFGPKFTQFCRIFFFSSQIMHIFIRYCNGQALFGPFFRIKDLVFCIMYMLLIRS